eukprot:SAG11_NODE_2085_length_3847_cov_2.866329_7_plen_132_part_01
MQRVKALAQLLTRDQQLVCGLCDHAKGQLFFTCPHHLDTLLPSAFPVLDTDRFNIEMRTEEELIQTVLLPLANQFVHLAPLRRPTTRKPFQLGVFYALMKLKYEPESPKYMSKLRPISNYNGDPLAPLLALI